MGQNAGSDWKAAQLMKLAAEGAKRDLSPLGMHPQPLLSVGATVIILLPLWGRNEP